VEKTYYSKKRARAPTLLYFQLRYISRAASVFKQSRLILDSSRHPLVRFMSPLLL
jgi:hypothetical protein